MFGQKASVAIMSAIAAAALLSACAPSPVEQELQSAWDRLGAQGQQQVCLGIALKGEDWFARQVNGEHEAEAVAFFVDHCEGVEPPSAESIGLSIPA